MSQNITKFAFISSSLRNVALTCGSPKKLYQNHCIKTQQGNGPGKIRNPQKLGKSLGLESDEGPENLASSEDNSQKPGPAEMLSTTETMSDENGLYWAASKAAWGEQLRELWTIALRYVNCSDATILEGKGDGFIMQNSKCCSKHACH